ncbi:MAG TPA: penicillin acylase family protein [Phycisphaerales bacterium]|nr:penicillin acylase family protein [Phycisphaerales bacterium]HRQ74388.1 penicillin acylase family protein [Phycisphaerales bacterium]
MSGLWAGLLAVAMSTVAVADHNALPILDGRVSVAGLAQPVEVARDRFGVPDIHGQTLHDVIRAQGFIHAQERFFQMDAGRRLAAGELSELVGPLMLDMDKRYRAYRFRHVAQQIVATLNDSERELLKVYAEGVNAGLEALPSAPPEYGMINATPAQWLPEDSILIVLAMFDMLHMEGRFEKGMGVMREALPVEIVDFFTPTRTRFDVPLLTEGETAWEPMPIPGPEVIDYRRMSAADVPTDIFVTEPIALGSNNWVVAGSRSMHGGAILANDPHLRLTAPGIWYHAQLRWPDHRLIGLTLPGVPGVAIGSNGYIAWGCTNAMGDFQDLIIIEVDPEDATRYRTPDGFESFGEIVERITLRGRGVETLRLQTTRWGTVTDHDHLGRPLVLKWTALDPGSINLGILDMVHVRTLEDAVEVARNWSGPSQNVVIAHRDGGIAWVVSGYLPDRFGFNGRYPVSWADGTKGWRGAIPEAERPVLVNPQEGILYTANNRTMSHEQAKKLGGIWTAGERAGRIAERLRERDRFSEDDLFEIQLDTRVAVFDFYVELAHEAMQHDVDVNDEVIREMLARGAQVLETWNGTADADQSAMILLDYYRRVLHSRILAPLISRCRMHDPTFEYRWFMDEEPLRRILEERPAHLLPPGNSTWEEFLARSWRTTLQTLTQPRFPNGFNTAWGEINRAQVNHPLTQAMPMLARSLNLAEAPQSGHPFAVRVATPTFGASARMVVSPGRESAGILHTPAGQSGHPQSPHYRIGHEEWLAGLPLPFAPQRTETLLRLEPTR